MHVRIDGVKAAILVESLTGNTWTAAEQVADLLQQERWTITGLSKVKQPDYQSIHDADLDPRRYVGARSVHLRTGAVGGIEHRQPAGDARQEGGGVLYVRARSGQGLDKLTNALGDTGAYVIGGLAMSRSKLGEHTEVFAERLVAATANA